jgi:hypothetical protein
LALGAALAVSLAAAPQDLPVLGRDDVRARFEKAAAAARGRAAARAPTVESELLYTIRFSERPGLRELTTRSVDVRRLALAARPSFWWPEARVHQGEHLWDGTVENLLTGGRCSLLERGCARLASAEPVQARGRSALRLRFEEVGEAGGRVEVTVDRESFAPMLVERVVEAPVEVYGVVLEEYRLRLSLASIAGLWLVAQGEETYRFTSPEGGREVRATWKSLAWKASPADTAHETVRRAAREAP